MAFASAFDFFPPNIAILLDLPPEVSAAVTFSVPLAAKRRRSPSPPPNRNSYSAALADYSAARSEYLKYMASVRRIKQTAYDKQCIKNLREMLRYYKEIINGFN